MRKLIPEFVHCVKRRQWHTIRKEDGKVMPGATPLLSKGPHVTTTIGFIILGLLAGIFSGLVGIGGGVLIVPALVLLFGMSQHTAQGTTIAMLVLPVGIAAAWMYHRQGMVDVSAAALLAAGFVVGSGIGARFAVALPPGTLEKIFGAAMMVIGLKMVLGR